MHPKVKKRIVRSRKGWSCPAETFEPSLARTRDSHCEEHQVDRIVRYGFGKGNITRNLSMVSFRRCPTRRKTRRNIRNTKGKHRVTASRSCGFASCCGLQRRWFSTLRLRSLKAKKPASRRCCARCFPHGIPGDIAVFDRSTLAN